MSKFGIESQVDVKTVDCNSDEMKRLLNHQNEINEWKNIINQKIYELETVYLDETNSLGNMIKGFDPDGRTHPIRREKDDTLRLFSNSSYEFWNELKINQELETDKKANNVSVSQPQKSQMKPSKKVRRSMTSTSQSIADSGWGDQPEFVHSLRNSSWNTVL